jgi:hypothetical protein
VRLARAAGLAVSAFSLAAGAHLAGGGSMPAGVWSAAILLLVFTGSVLVTGRRLGPVAIVALLGGSQLLLHRAFAFTEPAAAPCVAGAPEHGTHLAGAVAVCADPALATAAMQGMDHSMGGGATMVVAHTVAAVLLGLLLARGEEALWFLAAFVLPRWRVAVRCPVRPTAPRPEWPVPVLVPLETALGGVGRRGPPAPVMVAA